MPTDEGASQTLVWAWGQQRKWSKTADHLKANLDRSRNGALVLALSAVTLLVAAAQLTSFASLLGQSLGALSAISAGLATMIQRRLTTDHVGAWTRARSCAEGLKTEVYSYLAGGSSYTNSKVRDKALGERSRELVSKVEDLLRHTARVTTDSKPLPSVGDVDDYVAHRVDEQITNYYRPKARVYARRAVRLRRVATAFGTATVLLSIATTTFALSALAAWAAVATAAGMSVVAHIGATRYDHLIIEYLATAQRLEQLRESRVNEAIDDAKFVDECESAISVENQGWMARWNDAGTLDA